MDSNPFLPSRKNCFLLRVKVDRFTKRGLVYAIVSFLGLSYEVGFVHPPRLFVLVMYGLVLGVGLICIFKLKEREDEA